MNLLYPNFPWRLFPAMLGVALLGALVGGIYGIFHDLITYSISEEYFTVMKFDQFSYANFGLPPRLFAAEIGFIATGAVGLAAGWFLARTALPSWPIRLAMKRIFQSFLLIMVIAMIAAVIGYWLGLRDSKDCSEWNEVCSELGISNIPGFVQVVYIHYASYIGGLIGLIVAILRLCRLRKKEQVAELG